MRLVRIVALVLVGLETVALAQPAAPPAAIDGVAVTARGKVIDAAGRPLPGARISVEGQSAAVSTDVDGAFAVPAQIGTTLVVEADGYEAGIAIVTGEKLDDVVLLGISQAAETIEVKGTPPPSAPGAAKLDRQELQRVPGAGSDVVRALTVMPGVVNIQVPLATSGIAVRGSSPQDSKVLVDDFEVPLLYHNIGFRSVIPAESIQSLEFLPGGFDVAYGRASSGIVLLNTRPGDDKRTTQAEISMTDGGLLAQGRIDKRTTYMFGLRRSTLDYVLPAVIPSSVNLSLTTVPSYYDEQLRIDHQLDSKWRLSLSSLGALDTLELYTTKNTDAATKRFYNRTRFLRVTGSATYHDGPWNAKLALSALAHEFVFDIGAFQHVHVRQPSVTSRAEVTRTWNKAIGLTDVEWRGGAEVQVGRSSLDLASPPDIRDGETFQGYSGRDTSMMFRGKFWLPDFAAWTAVAGNLDPRIRFTVGMRADAFARSGEIAMQPRGELKIKLSPKLTARLSSGAYRRAPEFQDELVSANAQSEHATQNIAGLEYQPREGLRLQTSAYYTDRRDLLTRETPASELVNVGHGTTVGGELLATYRGGPWFGWLSYSYSRSTRVDRPGAMERLFSYDQPHSLNAAVSWKRGRWQLGGRFQLYSGLPYTPAVGSIFDSDNNRYMPVYGDTNSARAPFHHQLDLRIDYSWKLGPAALTAFLDVQNVYMNRSVVSYFPNYDFTQQQAFTSLPLIPSFGLRGVL